MRQHKFDSSFKDRYHTEYSQLDSVSQTKFASLANNKDGSQCSLKEITCALSIIVTLIVGSTWQLYRSLKTSPVGSSTTPTIELSESL